MAPPLVEARSVQRTSLHVARPTWSHTYAVPYLVVYLLIAAVYLWARAQYPGGDLLAANATMPFAAAPAPPPKPVVPAKAAAAAPPTASNAPLPSAVVVDIVPDGSDDEVLVDVDGAAAPEAAANATRADKEGGGRAPVDPVHVVDEIAGLAFVVAALGQIVAWLACHWSVNVRAAFTCRQVKDPFEAQYIKVIPAEHRGAGELCPLQRNPDVRDRAGRPQLWFSFQRRKFEYDADERKQFRRVSYPIGETLGFYQKATGYPTPAAVAQAAKRWGVNSLDIPLPTFLELYKEHAVAPFFVFQVFCVALWCLDEYWYYSIFTLVMLLIFESTIVFQLHPPQRLRNMTELRKMAPQPYAVSVYRAGAWVQVQTTELLPGDLCSIERSQDDRTVPCDLVLVQGSCIVNEAMLTGESTPQLKESVADRDANDTLDIIAKDRNYVLFAGTKIVQSTFVPNDANRIPPPPNGGAVAYVLRTGFDTSQGKLVRTILFSTERVTANNLESLFFILFLLVFAIAAAYYVWVHGAELGRSRWSLVLDCVLIITSVVPPDLPMQLALAVNQSLLALQRSLVFCTEPFRIPYAGKVDICCFDKTGTLTSEELVVQGVCGLGDKPLELSAPATAPNATARVIGLCHSLLIIDDGSVCWGKARTLVGDPMEMAAMKSVGWSFNKGNVAKSPEGRQAIRIVRRFAFSSQLKRMAVVCAVENPSEGETGLLVAVKGAPETLATMLANKPAFYDTTHKQIAAQGSRVIALAYKWLPTASQQHARNMSRDEAESDLIFAGFLAFHCPVKPDSKGAVELLLQSSHRVIMITGDNALTACHVAQEVSIMRRSVAILDGPGDESHPTTYTDLRWWNVHGDELRSVETSRREFEQALFDNDVCFTGRALMAVAAEYPKNLGKLLAHVRVFARTSPQEKELILTAMKKAGYVTLMCGDGTNDVGALKQAHVGVALLDGKPEDIPKFMERMKLANIQKRAMAQRRQRELMMQAQQLQRQVSAANTPAARRAQAQQQRDALLQMAKEAMSEIEDDVPMVKLGDASIAAPFTSKISYVTSIVNIVRQGRSALVTTMQMYKILALSCLITAYGLSVLYLDGIKHGDTQMTIQGILLTVCFLGLANAKMAATRLQPAENLSKRRPLANIFNLYILLSVIGQFAVHVIAMREVTALAKAFMPEMEKVDLERKFEANLLNSGIYLVSLSMHVSTFMVNYQGRPFRESMFENKPMFYTLSAVMGICVFAATDSSPAFREWLELVPFPTEYRDRLIQLIAFDFFGSWGVELVTNWLFANNRPDPYLRLD